jgi:hypothetical protein
MELESARGLKLLRFNSCPEELNNVPEMLLQYVEYYVLEEMIDLARPLQCLLLLLLRPIYLLKRGISELLHFLIFFITL